MVECSGGSRERLSGLVRDQIVGMHSNAAVAPQCKSLGKDGPATQDETQKREQAGTMLAAHEAQWAAPPENITRFEDVLEYLKQDLHQESPAN